MIIEDMTIGTTETDTGTETGTITDRRLMMTGMISPAEATKEGLIIMAVVEVTGAADTRVIGTTEEAEMITGIDMEMIVTDTETHMTVTEQPVTYTADHPQLQLLTQQ